MVLNFGKKLIEGPTAEILANDEVAAIYLGTAAARPARGAPATEAAEASPIAPDKQRAALAALVAPKAAAAAAPLIAARRICAGYGQARVLKASILTHSRRARRSPFSAPTAPARRRWPASISGALKPTSGRLRIDGQDVTGARAASDRRARRRPLHGGPAHLSGPLGPREPPHRGARRRRPPRRKGASKPSMISSLFWRSARTSRARRCRAASSRCWRSAAR